MVIQIRIQAQEVGVVEILVICIHPSVRRFQVVIAGLTFNGAVIVGICRVKINGAGQTRTFDLNLIDVVSPRTNGADVQTDRSQYVRHVHILDIVLIFIGSLSFLDLGIANPELVLGERFNHGLFAAAFLYLIVQVVHSLSSAHVAVVRISKEVVTFQHLGRRFPLFLFSIISEGEIRVDFICQLVFFQPSQLGPLFRIFIRQVFVAGSPNIIHQQGADRFVTFPSPVSVARVKTQARVSVSAFHEIEGNILNHNSALVGFVKLLRVADEILIGTSSEQCSHHRCRE